MTPLQVIARVREIADGRRHYDGGEGYTCYDALGDIRAICDEVLTRPAYMTPKETIDQINAFFERMS